MVENLALAMHIPFKSDSTISTPFLIDFDYSQSCADVFAWEGHIDDGDMEDISIT